MKAYVNIQVLCPMCDGVMMQDPRFRDHRYCGNANCRLQGLVFHVPALQVDIELTTKTPEE